jgi:hypothetical protein
MDEEALSMLLDPTPEPKTVDELIREYQIHFPIATIGNAVDSESFSFLIRTHF